MQRGVFRSLRQPRLDRPTSLRRVWYGRQRGGAFGRAVLRQYGTWAVVIFVMGLLPGLHVNNWGHAGGFAGGFLAALVLGAGEYRPERGVHRVLAAGCLGLTALGFALALWTAAGG